MSTSNSTNESKSAMTDNAKRRELDQEEMDQFINQQIEEERLDEQRNEDQQQLGPQQQQDFSEEKECERVFSVLSSIVARRRYARLPQATETRWTTGLSELVIMAAAVGNNSEEDYSEGSHENHEFIVNVVNVDENKQGAENTIDAEGKEKEGSCDDVNCMKDSVD
jgi:hypothetical protein